MNSSALDLDGPTLDFDGLLAALQRRCEHLIAIENIDALNGEARGYLARLVEQAPETTERDAAERGASLARSYDHWQERHRYLFPEVRGRCRR